MTTYRAHKPSHGRPVPFALCGIGKAALPVPDVCCRDCTHARRLQARAWRGCAAGHPPHRALELHACDAWQPLQATP